MNHFMSKYLCLFAILFVTTVALQGCSTKRDGRAYRIYHNTTARYNGFYYANEAMGHDKSDKQSEALNKDVTEQLEYLTLLVDEYLAKENPSV